MFRVAAPSVQLYDVWWTWVSERFKNFTSERCSQQESAGAASTKEKRRIYAFSVSKKRGCGSIRIDPQIDHVLSDHLLRPRADDLSLTHFTQSPSNLTGKRNDDEDAKERLYTYAAPVLGITDFKGLQTEVIDDAE